MEQDRHFYNFSYEKNKMSRHYHEKTWETATCWVCTRRFLISKI